MSDDIIIQKINAKIEKCRNARAEYIKQSQSLNGKAEYEAEKMRSLIREVKGIERDIFMEGFYLPDIIWIIEYNSGNCFIMPSDLNTVAYQDWKIWLHENIPGNPISYMYELYELMLLVEHACFIILFEEAGVDGRPEHKLLQHERMLNFIKENKMKVCKDSINELGHRLCADCLQMNHLPKELLV